MKNYILNIDSWFYVLQFSISSADISSSCFYIFCEWNSDSQLLSNYRYLITNLFS